MIGSHLSSHLQVPKAIVPSQAQLTSVGTSPAGLHLSCTCNGGYVIAWTCTC